MTQTPMNGQDARMEKFDPRMGAFDAVMWDVEDDPMLRSVIVLVVTLDDEPDPEILTERINRMTLDTPKMRQIPIGNPLSLAPPRWHTDPDFDLDYHLRWQRLPRDGGGLANVLALAEQIAEQDFDQSRPLWEATVVTGLADDKSAVIIKLHHAITDGVGGMAMLAVMFDLDPDNPTQFPPLATAPEPRPVTALDRIRDAAKYEYESLADRLGSAARAGASYLRRAATDPMTTAVSTGEWAQSAARMLAPASGPMSDVMTGRSLLVAFSVAEVELDDLKAAAHTVNGTINDAFMSAVTGGLRRYHERNGSHVDALRVNMPINVRSDGNADGNHWVPARFPIPVNVSDAGARMKQLHPILIQARNEPALGLSDVVYRLLSTMPRPLTTVVAAKLMKCTDVAATNVPGPPMPLFIAGAQVLGMIPFAPKGGAAVNIGLLSYAGTAFIGINCDRAAIEDPDEFTDCFISALNDVVALGSRS